MIARLAAGLAGAIAGIWMLVASAQTPPPEVAPLSSEVETFIRVMKATHGFDEGWLRRTLSEVKPLAGVQRAIAAPSTAKPWHEFKPLFVDRQRIENGVKFWNEHAELLARAQERFAVPASIIVAIIGVETRYGRMTGGFAILDALYTLGFHSDNRPAFFRDELEQFFLLARDQNWDVTKPKGSYAGAMGWPQFMPSSYRRYAIDFDGDGRVDLWNSPADVIGSVASYMREFGWKDGAPVVAPAVVDGDPAPLIGLGLTPEFTVAQWRMRGVDAKNPVDDALLAALFRLDLIDGPLFMLGFENFHTILHYNRSRHYAMAVYELANEIEQERKRAQATTSRPDAQAKLRRVGAAVAARAKPLRRAGSRQMLAAAAQHDKTSSKRKRDAAVRRARAALVLERG